MPDPPPIRLADLEAPQPEEGTPTAVRTTAAVAWLLAAFCFVVAADRLEGWADVAFFTLLGGWSAYLGLALTRGVAQAWVACRLVAVGTAGVNLLIALGMTGLLIAGALGHGEGTFLVPADRALAFVGFAVVLVAGPITVFRALGRGKVRQWFGLEDEDGLPIRPTCV